MSDPLAYGAAYPALLEDAMVARLKQKLQIEVDSDSPTHVGLIRAGLLQSDKAIEIISIVTQQGKHKGHFYNDYTVKASPYEVGSPVQAFERAFVVHLEFFFRGETDRDAARRRATVVMSAATAALLSMDAPRVRDDFGEGPLERHPIILSQTAPEGGGPGNLIWKSDITLAFITELDPPEDD